MRFVARFGLAVALFLALSGEARAYTYTHVFTAIDAVTVDANVFIITGVRQGEAAPVTLTCPSLSTSSTLTSVIIDSCRTMALAAMARPGEYLFEAHWNSASASTFGCTLTRVTP